VLNPHYSVNNVRKLNILGFYLYYICYQYEELAKCNRPNEIVPLEQHDHSAIVYGRVVTIGSFDRLLNLPIINQSPSFDAASWNSSTNKKWSFRMVLKQKSTLVICA
jgi:hypothetical protein